MEPTARSRTVPLFPVVCLALVAAFVLAAGGRAATGDTLPSPLAYADALGNIALSTDPAFSPINLTDDWKGDTNPACLLYTSPSPRARTRSRMPSSA